jgi:hypothetical protein
MLTVVRSMGALAALAILSVAASTAAQGTAANQASANRTDSPLTMEECHVWTALGRSVFGWGAKAADNRQFVIFYRPSGNTYVEQCPWSQLGVTPPPTQTPNLDNIEFFGTPDFQDGGLTAVVSKTTRIKGNPRLFMETDSCLLKKSNGRWTLDRCTMAAIT